LVGCFTLMWCVLDDRGHWSEFMVTGAEKNLQPAVNRS